MRATHLNTPPTRQESKDGVILRTPVQIATPADFRSILRLNRLFNDIDAADPERINETIQAQQFFVCRIEGKVVAAMGLQLRDEKTALIETIIVQPELRGRGLGRELVGMAVQWGKEKNAKHLWVESDVSYGARPFYEKCGFKLEGSFETYLMGESYLRFTMKLHTSR